MNKKELNEKCDAIQIDLEGLADNVAELSSIIDDLDE